MLLKLRALEAPYALATGNTVIERVKTFGALPEGSRDDYKHWLETHRTLVASAGAAAKVPDARRVDPFVDRAILLAAHACQNIVDAYTDVPLPLDDDQRQRLADARLVLESFDADRRKLVGIPFVEEWSAVRDVLHDLIDDPTVAKAVARLGLTSDVRLARKLHELYGRSLGIGTGAPATDEEAQLIAWNESFSSLVVAAQHHDRKHAGLLSVFADPYQEHLTRQQGAARPTRKRTPDAPEG
ncbi:MAG: hypothetical protein EOO75_06650 [Myxococcales bacterium]|nr:MAG: hypothetical protein EOO75_06650 [Myxococcales bacterium]